jgi:hypothetical protein
MTRERRRTWRRREGEEGRREGEGSDVAKGEATTRGSGNRKNEK